MLTPWQGSGLEKSRSLSIRSRGGLCEEGRAHLRSASWRPFDLRRMLRLRPRLPPRRSLLRLLLLLLPLSELTLFFVARMRFDELLLLLLLLEARLRLADAELDWLL